MAEVIKMPRLSDTMTEGVIAAWHKKVGDTVKKGDLLAEIETDKATMDLESYQEGTLLHVAGDKGAKIQVDDLLVILGKPGEDISGLVSGNGAAANDEKKVEKVEPEAAEKPAAGEDGKTEAAKPAEKQDAAPKPDLANMEEVVLMPRLSDTMTEGVIASWVKQVGEEVKKGDVLAEIETDKATMELESYKNGTLLYQGAAAGEKIQVNDLLAIIGAKDFKIDEVVAAAKGGAGSGTTPAAGDGKNAEQPEPVAEPKATANGADKASQNGHASTEMVNEGRVLASPLAKKLAADKGIDLRYVKGSGDGGRIVKTDVDNYQAPAKPAAQEQQASPKQDAAPAAVTPFVPGANEGYTDADNSQMRKVIAKRLSESMFTAPHFYLKMEVNMDGAMQARAMMNELSPVKISFNDIIMKACAMALRKHPAVNSSWMGDFIRTYQHIHIGMAVAIPDGLIVPVIRFADQKSLSQIAAEAKDLGGKAKNKKLQPNEFTGNTFTVSNLGMMDIDEFTAIINPPDSCILAVGKIKEEVYRKESGEFDVRNVMKLTLSCDHRSVDGAVGAAFMQTLKAYLENPVNMMV